MPWQKLKSKSNFVWSLESKFLIIDFDLRKSASNDLKRSEYHMASIYEYTWYFTSCLSISIVFQL